MRRWATVAMAAAIALAGAMPVAAQETEVPGRPGYLDLGVYTGGSYTTEWFSAEDAGGEREGWEPGYAPEFGAMAQIWIDPRFGVRLHGGYLPQNLPGAGGLDQSLRVVNSYVYDVDVVVRPFVLSTPNKLLQTVYLFAGGGGYTANVGDYLADDASDRACIPSPDWSDDGVCVSTDAEYSTTGMAVVGGGIRLAQVTRDIEAFGELAVHAYDSPAHVREGSTGRDRLTFTPHAVIGLKTSLGRRAPSAPKPLPPPPPQETPRPIPQPDSAPQPVVASEPATQPLAVCVISNDELLGVQARYNPITGDTTVNGVPFARAFPADSLPGTFAESAAWYVSGEPVTFQGRRYVKFGLPRVLRPGDVGRAGEFRGVSVFTEPIPRPEVIYLPVGAGCEFQPYQLETKISAVRG